MSDNIGGEGYVKFDLHWQKEPIDLDADVFRILTGWRSRLYELGYIGVYPDGIGYGNLSVRIENSNEFFITGSATGGIAILEWNHYARVTDYQIDKNTLSSRGLVKASSESMSHAAIYDTLPSVGAVFHIHSFDLWERYRDVLPTTDSEAEYGTPDMAYAIGRLARVGRERGADSGVLVMGGHQDGILSYGADADAAGSQLLELAETS